MAHPYGEHRAHIKDHSRVGHILREHGGHTIGKPHRKDHADEAEDRAVVKAMVKPSALKRMAGGRVKANLGKPARARGGKVHKGKTNVNVIVGHPGASTPMPVPVPAAGQAPLPPAVPRPPMAAPMPPPGVAPPMGGPPGLPMGPRKTGGRTYAKGGAVKPGPGWTESEKTKTQVQHLPGKNDRTGLGRGKPITYKRGGSVADKDPPGRYLKDTEHEDGPARRHGGRVVTHHADGGTIEVPDLLNGHTHAPAPKVKAGRHRTTAPHVRHHDGVGMLEHPKSHHAGRKTGGPVEHPQKGGMGPKFGGGGRGGLARLEKAHRAAR